MMTKRLLAVFCLVFVTGVPVMSKECSSESCATRSLVSSIRIDGPLSFCAEPVPLDRADVRERLEKELLISLWDRPQAILWLKRSTRYFPVIESILKRNGLPDDLKYMALAESALRPHAGSPKGAVGFWQFMPETARKYDLRLDRFKDERRNVFKSTEGAARYLKDLHADLGSWTLAAAAFNMGEEGLKSEMLAQGIEDYYRLYLSLETQRYLLRVLSVKLILEDPDRFGFTLIPEDFYAPFDAERLTVDCPEETALSVVAGAAKTDFKWIKDLNPEIRGHYLEKGRHEILVPKGGSKGFERRFRRAFEAWAMERKKRIYVVQGGDNLSIIAERFEVPLPVLMIWNRLDLSKPIHPGDRLIIHKGKEKISAD
jgi:hypothetical protein